MDIAGLRSPDPERRKRAWSELESLPEESLKSLEGRRLYLRSLLWHRLQGVREEAWKHLPLYAKLGVSGVERAFQARSDRVKLTAWSHYSEVISLGLVSREEMIRMRQHFWRLLRSFYPTVRKKAWSLLVSLVRDGIVGGKDKERFLSYLEHRKAGVRLLAWSKAMELEGLGFITKEDLSGREGYLKELVDGRGKVSGKAKKIMEVLRL